MDQEIKPTTRLMRKMQIRDQEMTTRNDKDSGHHQGDKNSPACEVNNKSHQRMTTKNHTRLVATDYTTDAATGRHTSNTAKNHTNHAAKPPRILQATYAAM